MRSKLTAVIVTIVILTARPALAWINTGHKIIAMIAWKELTPKSRAAITELLKQHPRYEKDLLADAEEGATPEQLAEHAFAVASTWPDIVRAQEHPMHATFHHARWHYITIPFEDGAKATLEADSGPPPHDIVEALTQCTTELKDAAISGDRKAVDLCWIAHLVGDLHQPLHAVSRYSTQFPKGDAGGNYEIVLAEPPYPDTAMKLHLVWDSLPGNFATEINARYIAAGLSVDPKYSREQFKSQLANRDLMAWAQESHKLAVEIAYLNGELKSVASTKGASAATTKPIPGLPPGYRERAERCAMQRVALAGYRLADVLNQLLDPSP